MNDNSTTWYDRVKPIETERLILRRLTADDAEFILGLLNQPSFLHYIGDRGVRSLEDAKRYIETGAVASYERFDFGLCMTLLKEGKVPIGICGLIKRDGLENADIGYAFLPQYWAQGFATEAAAAVMEDARKRLNMKRLLGITTRDNPGSACVLEKTGLRFERMIKLPRDEAELMLFAWEV